MKPLLSLLIAGSALALAGCVTNPIVGHGIVQTGRYHGDVGVTGNGATVTIEAGSDVPKLSIVGDACNITVADGASVRHIEFWGAANTVSIPDNLSPIVAAVGTNKVVRRPAGGTTQPAGK